MLPLGRESGAVLAAIRYRASEAAFRTTCVVAVGYLEAELGGNGLLELQLGATPSSVVSRSAVYKRPD